MHQAGVQKIFVKQLFRETRSVTAVEFALIGPVLFFLLFCIVLLGVGQFWQLTLDDAVRNAARQVAIGPANASTGIHNSADFVTSVCGEFGQAAPNCSGSLQFAVQGAATFAGITPATLSAGGQLSPNAAFSGVTANEPVLVQAVYPLPISIPLVPMSFTTLNGTPSIVAAAAIGAEP